MKVLLVGDYSSVHYFLSLGLSELGVDVTLVSSGDGGKKIPTDIRWNARRSNRLLRTLSLGGLDFVSKNSSIINSFSGYDVVQVINPVLVEEASVFANKEIFDFLKSNNGKIFLYSCGDDYNWVSSCLSESDRNSMFGEGKLYRSKEIIHPIRYLINPFVRSLCKHVYSNVDGIIPGSFDYSWCVKQLDKKREVIPFPVDLKLFHFEQLKRKNRYQITHGFQPGKSIRKGDRYFEESINHVGHKFDYKKIGGIPFFEYIKLLGQGDIFFDQVHSKDQGMNAVFAMAKGKVVFSGYGEEFTNHYDLKEKVGLDAPANSIEIARTLLSLLDGDLDLESISFNARRFVEDQHDHRNVAAKFVRQWDN